MRIGELAELSGIPPTALRYYERSGLLHSPERTDGGYREYAGDVLPRLAFIRAAQAVGLSLTEIREVINIRDTGTPPCAHLVDLLERHRAEVVVRIRELKRLETELARLAARGSQIDPSECDPSCVCEVIPTPAYA